MIAYRKKKKIIISDERRIIFLKMFEMSKQFYSLRMKLKLKKKTSNNQITQKRQTVFYIVQFYQFSMKCFLGLFSTELII